MMNCRKCDLKLIIKNVDKKNHIECRSCNLGCFTSNCGCKYYTINIKEYWCENCNIQHDSCKKCNILYDKLNNKYCYECVEIIKNNNPSTNNNIYEYDEKYIEWKLCGKKCKTCNCIKEMEDYKFHNDTCNYCEIQKELDNINNSKNEHEFMIIDNKIKGRKICLCGYYTDWVDKFYIIEDNKTDNVLQCKNCNPSTDLSIYNYTDCNVWNLQKSGMKCKLCDVILWRKNNCAEYWGDLIQCKIHEPQNNFIKFKLIDRYVGYKINKIKVFSNGKHYWKTPPYNISANYECDCIKCKTT